MGMIHGLLCLLFIGKFYTIPDELLLINIVGANLVMVNGLLS